MDGKPENMNSKPTNVLDSKDLVLQQLLIAYDGSLDDDGRYGKGRLNVQGGRSFNLKEGETPRSARIREAMEVVEEVV